MAESAAGACERTSRPRSRRSQQYGPTNNYIRGFYKFPQGFSLPDTCHGGKLIYARDYDYGATIMVIGRQPYSGGKMGFHVEITHPSHNVYCNLGDCSLPLDGAWHSIEMHLDVPRLKKRILLARRPGNQHPENRTRRRRFCAWRHNGAGRSQGTLYSMRASVVIKAG